MTGRRIHLPGSSPLARGLRPGRSDSGGAPRIIPARAGFTASSGRWLELPGDHPRSRGVYRMVLSEQSKRDGSSPLARGLRAIIGPGEVVRGIIPARAGFTAPACLAAAPAADHPRSRGVYLAWNFAALRIQGSSPLARGLRGDAQRRHQAARIIPARAGFTSPVVVIMRRLPDHPRSRGVYPGH